MKLFVPGRICLFGEHSDWAGGYRRTNSNVEKGYAIITGTNQGLYAEVEPHSTRLQIRSSAQNGIRDSFEVDMEAATLLAQARSGGFYSYACGVAYQFLTQHNVRGLTIDNYKTDLPITKGLSSSAAICVLTARAFNRVYDLKMTVRGEMEYAYQGEINTPSRCGRMDQGCAYGERPILMTFDGDRIEVEELRVPKDLHFVIVDLKAQKDTMEILAALNRCYPVANGRLQARVHECLGSLNAEIVGPACPKQLAAPVLHKVLELASRYPFVLGAKGVGSQGDGTAQILVQDREGQETISGILEKELGVPSLPLTIASGKKVRRAVVPAAGFGTRLFPASKAVKKELFPILDESGRVKPAILAIVEELVRSGIEEVGLIVQERDRDILESLFLSSVPTENYNKLTKSDQEYCRHIQDLGRRVTLLVQEVADGFGHAVYCAREWVNGEPFLLALGDHLYRSQTDVSCTRQILDQFERHNTSVVGLKVVSVDQARSVGCVVGRWRHPKLLEIARFAEKPGAQYAREHLVMQDLPDDRYLGLFGEYVLTDRIFSLLEEKITGNQRIEGEFDLTTSLDQLRQEEGFLGYLVDGESFDIGIPDNYRRTFLDLAN